MPSIPGVEAFAKMSPQAPNRPPETALTYEGKSCFS